MSLRTVAFALAAAGCATAPAVGSNVRLRPETRPECAAHCETLGMRLGAIVLIRSSAGCVCQPHAAPPAAGAATPPPEPRAALDAGGADVAGGALVIAFEEEEEAQRLAAQAAHH